MRHLLGTTHVKVQVFLSPLRDRQSGNLVLLPGSHRRPLPPKGSMDWDAEGQYIVEPQVGDVIIWDASLLHRVQPNTSPTDRISAIFAFGFTWMSPYDYWSLDDGFAQDATELERMLVSVPREGSYYPKDGAERRRILESRLGVLGDLPFTDALPYIMTKSYSAAEPA
jgi:hypothetical protein